MKAYSVVLAFIIGILTCSLLANVTRFGIRCHMMKNSPTLPPPMIKATNGKKSTSPLNSQFWQENACITNASLPLYNSLDFRFAH